MNKTKVAVTALLVLMFVAFVALAAYDKSCQRALEAQCIEARGEWSWGHCTFLSTE